jgi:hypothetical protein
LDHNVGQSMGLELRSASLPGSSLAYRANGGASSTCLSARHRALAEAKLLRLSATIACAAIGRYPRPNTPLTRVESGQEQRYWI